MFESLVPIKCNLRILRDDASEHPRLLWSQSLVAALVISSCSVRLMQQLLGSDEPSASCATTFLADELVVHRSSERCQFESEL